MQIENKRNWEIFQAANSKDDDKLGMLMVKHIKRWCECMEKRLEDGQDFAAIQFKEDEELFKSLGLQYPVQFMEYTLAATLKFWKYGKAFEKWFGKQFMYEGRLGQLRVDNNILAQRQIIVDLPLELKNNKTKIPVASAKIPFDIISEKYRERYLEFTNDMSLDYLYRVKYGGKWCLHFSYEGVEMKVFKFDCLDTWKSKTKRFGY